MILVCNAANRSRQGRSVRSFPETVSIEIYALGLVDDNIDIVSDFIDRKPVRACVPSTSGRRTCH
jgi:hypothetical protein